MSRMLPLMVSGVFIVVGVWAGIEAWNGKERKELPADWEGQRLPEELWKFSPESAPLVEQFPKKP